ncbi:MAG: ArsA family ATPase [Candidatus Binataceae bacterium]
MALPRLIFITGKGGTGKSTVAAALADALSRRHRTTLADLDRRLTAARLLGAKLNGAAAARINQSLDVVALSPRAEIESFIERVVPVRAIARRMLRSRTFGYVTAAVPGLEAFLFLERLRTMAGDAALNDRYLVVDGPASGTALELLAVSGGVKGVAPRGTLNRLGEAVETFLHDPHRFGVLITATPDDFAVREALETAHALGKPLGVRVIGAVLNCVPSKLFDAADLAAAGAAVNHAKLAIRRSVLDQRAVSARRELGEANIGVIELPMLFTAKVARAGVRALAGALAPMLAAP